MATAHSTPVDALGASVIAMARAFEPVRPLVKRSRLMSLNARMTASKLGEDGASFAVVAQALGGLAEELSELVVEVEEILGRQVEQVSRAVKSQGQLRLVAEAVRLSGLGNPTLDQALRPESVRQWEESWRRGGPEGSELWRTLLDSRRRMVEDLLGLERSTEQMVAALTRVERVAVMRGFFVGTNARIEASRLPGGTDGLGHLAEQLDELAAEIATEIRSVTRNVKSVRRDCGTVTRPLHPGAQRR